MDCGWDGGGPNMVLTHVVTLRMGIPVETNALGLDVVF